MKSNSESANKWRVLTRRAFTEAINAGFTVENFFMVNRGDRKNGVYLLTRKD
jgi:predicted GNAT superfamily acetyltransferase